MQLNENDRLLWHCGGVANATDYIRLEYEVETVNWDWKRNWNWNCEVPLSECHSYMHYMPSFIHSLTHSTILYRQKWQTTLCCLRSSPLRLCHMHFQWQARGQKRTFKPQAVCVQHIPQPRHMHTYAALQLQSFNPHVDCPEKMHRF